MLFSTIFVLVVISFIIIILYKTIRSKSGDDGNLIQIIFKFIIYLFWIIGLLGYFLNKNSRGTFVFFLVVIGFVFMYLSGKDIVGIFVNINRFLDSAMLGDEYIENPNKKSNKNDYNGDKMVFNKEKISYVNQDEINTDINKYNMILEKYSKVKTELSEKKQKIQKQFTNFSISDNNLNSINNKIFDTKFDNKYKEEKNTDQSENYGNNDFSNQTDSISLEKAIVDESRSEDDIYEKKETIVNEVYSEEINTLDDNFEKQDKENNKLESEKQTESDTIFNSNGSLFGDIVSQEKSSDSGLFSQSKLFD